MRISTHFLFTIFLFLQLSSSSIIAQNPPASGFNLKGSDPKAIAIADEVMNAIGGRKNWDKTRYLSWKFFSYRKLVWDRYTGDVSIHDFKSDIWILMNVNTGNGKVSRKGLILTDTSAECKKALERGKKILINDSYWLIMPMKFKDSGVTLKYMGAGISTDGNSADILQLTFDHVGVTPENKYWVYVDCKTKLVTQWSFFRNATDEKPEFTNPWTDYRKYGKILLSSGRGREEGGISEIEVAEKMDRKIFTQF